MKRTTIPILTVLALSLSIHSFAQKDTAKYCFTGAEMNEWIKSAINEKAYKATFDTLQNVVKIDESIIVDLNTLNKSADRLIEEQQKSIRKRKLSVYLWQFIAGAISAGWIYTLIR
jgi:uncharacterized protein HemX